MSEPSRRGDERRLRQMINQEDGDAVALAVENLRGRVYAESTKRSNKSRVRKYEQVMAGSAINKTPFPIDRSKLECFAAVMHSSGYRSVSQYLDAVIAENESKGYDLADSDRRMIKKWKRACVRGQVPPEGREPLTFGMLLRLHNMAVNVSAKQRACLFTAGWWFLLRGDEVVELQVKDITFMSKTGTESGDPSHEGCSVRVKVAGSKTDQAREGTVREHGCVCKHGETGPVICPVHVLEFIISHRRHQGAKPDGPLFVDEKGEGWQKDILRNKLIKDLKNAGVEDVKRYGLHSMRVGRTQWLLRAGVDKHRVQRFGRWSSDAINKYARDVYILDSPEYSSRVLDANGGNYSQSGNKFGAKSREVEERVVYKQTPVTSDRIEIWKEQEVQLVADTCEWLIEAETELSWFIDPGSTHGLM